MSENAKDKSNWVPIMTAVLSLISAVGVALIGYQVNRDKLAVDQARVAMERADSEIKAKLDQIYAEVEQETLALEQRRFEAAQRDRRDSILKEYVPKLLGEDEAGRQEAVALLFVIYPNDARNILSQVAEALSEDQAETLEPLVERAQTLDEKTGEWAVVIGADSQLEDPGALYEAALAKDQGYEAAIYFKDNWYHTTIGPFPTQVDAERAQIIVRTKFPGGSYRQGAYIVNLNQWCPEPVRQENYVECKTP